MEVEDPRSFLFVARDGSLYCHINGTRSACLVGEVLHDRSRPKEPYLILRPPIQDAMLYFENLDEDLKPSVPRCICGRYCWAHEDPHILSPCSGRLQTVEGTDIHYCNEHGPPDAAEPA